ncbi:MAG: hypothetical protein ACJ8EY_00330 [Sphingomicrobium sp.]
MNILRIATAGVALSLGVSACQKPDRTEPVENVVVPVDGDNLTNTGDTNTVTSPNDRPKPGNRTSPNDATTTGSRTNPDDR